MQKHDWVATMKNLWVGCLGTKLMHKLSKKKKILDQRKWKIIDKCLFTEKKMYFLFLETYYELECES